MHHFNNVAVVPLYINTQLKVDCEISSLLDFPQTFVLQRRIPILRSAPLQFSELSEITVLSQMFVKENCTAKCLL